MEETPLQPKIKQILQATVPGNMVGAFSITVFGLGEDSKLYSWNGQQKIWVLSS